MSKLVRKTSLLFGSNSGINQIAQFGSLANGSPTYSLDPAVLQALSQYLVGWFGGAIGGAAPAIQDVNCLDYLASYFLCYLFQQGIAEYDSATTYYTGSYITSSGVIYRSLQDNNTGNALTDGTNWDAIESNGIYIPSSSHASITVPSGETLFHPYLTIDSSKTYTVAGQLVSVGSITVNGTLVASGTVKVL